MSLFEKPLNEILEDDLLRLVDNKIPEGKLIEYKKTLPGNSDNDKKEFLADVSSFANTLGGYLLFGIEENQGIATYLLGIKNIDPDKEKLRLNNIIRDGIQPRIFGIDIQSIQLKNKNYIIVIHIPQSYSAPHMITFKQSNRFYARNSAGKYLLDVHELRQAFLLYNSATQRIRDFRHERIAKINARETPIGLQESKGILVVHIVPIFSLFHELTIPIQELMNISKDSFKSISHSRYNLDGLIKYLTMYNNSAQEYYQIYRSGIVEYVSVNITHIIEEQWVIATRSLEEAIIEGSWSALSFQRKCEEIKPPIFIFVSTLDVKDTRLGLSYHYPIDLKIKNDLILVPEVMLDEYPKDQQELARLLKPALDVIYNAGGLPGSPYFDEQGNRVQ